MAEIKNLLVYKLPILVNCPLNQHVILQAGLLALQEKVDKVLVSCVPQRDMIFIPTNEHNTSTNNPAVVFYAYNRPPLLAHA